jgi:large subunit ribosomal protein L5
MTSLDKHYLNTVKDSLKKKLDIKNIMAVPKMLKIVISVGLGEALENKKVIEVVSRDLATITGQKPVICLAKKDISTFKLRRGEPIGLKVTLRAKKMYDFMEKLIKIVLPRIRDFRGVSATAFDKKGCYTLGMAEQIVFSEIDYSQIDKVRGLEITFVTSGRNSQETRCLLEDLGIPFKKN